LQTLLSSWAGISHITLRALWADQGNANSPSRFGFRAKNLVGAGIHEEVALIAIG
jgi:hypothetical protein